MLNKSRTTQQFLTLLISVTLIFAMGCASTTKQQEGAVIGTVIGGVLGAELGNDKRSSGRKNVSILAGALIGGLIGSSIGQYMDDVDRMKTGRALENSPTGVSSSWVNPDTSNRYIVTPTKTYEQDVGPCREYTMQAIIGGKQETVYGTACRQADGSWKTQ